MNYYVADTHSLYWYLIASPLLGTNAKNAFSETKVSDKTLREMLKNQRIANTAVHKAQEENRKLGIPNWYSINGIVTSDLEILDKNKKVSE